jgi:ABC-type multidrug transport system fused ATPase/permease subunit
MKKTIIFFFQILKRIKEKKFLLVVFLIFLASLTEIFSIGLIIPLVSNFADPLYYLSISNIFKNIIFLKNINVDFYPLFFLLLFVISYFIKAVIQVYTLKTQLNYSFNLGSIISEKIFNKYINLDYQEYLNRRSSDFIRNITTEVSAFVSSFLIPFLFLISELLILFLILSLLFFFEFKVTLFLSCFSFAIIYTYFYIVKNYLTKWGKDRQYNEGKRFKVIQDIFNSLKDIKIFQNETIYFNQFSKSNLSLKKISIKQNLFLGLPRILIELLAISSFSIFFLIIFMQKKSIINYVPIFALYGISSLRLLPSFGKILTSLQNIKYSETSVNIIASELLSNKNLAPNKNKIIIKKNIYLSNIKFNYAGDKKNILNRLDFNLILGKKIFISGDSGSGKTSFLDILLGLYMPSTGKILIDENEINENHSWMHNFSYVPQKPYFFENTISKNVAFRVIDLESDKKKLEQALRISELWELYEQLNFDLNKDFGNLSKKISGGQYQRLAIARAIFNMSNILILDEATNALDKKTEKKVLDNIFNSDDITTVIVISHNKEIANYCDEVFLLQNHNLERIK